MGLATAEDRERRDLAYYLWLGAAGRNVAETARRLGMPRTSVQNWHDRDSWAQRAAEDDAALRESVTADVWNVVYQTAPIAARRLRSVITGEPCYSAMDGTALPPPDRHEQRLILTTLAYIGVVPQRAVTVTLQTTPTLDVSDAELEHYRVTGNVAALLALAAGRPPEPPPPADFASGQPGGRGVPDPPSSLPRQNGKPSREDREAYGEAITDVSFRELTGDDGG